MKCALKLCFYPFRRVLLQYVPPMMLLYLLLLPAQLQVAAEDEIEAARSIFGMAQIFMPLAALWPQFIYFLPIKQIENRELIRGLQHPDGKCSLVLWLGSLSITSPIIMIYRGLLPHCWLMSLVIMIQVICTIIGFHFLSELCSSAVAGTVAMVIYLAISTQIGYYDLPSLIRPRALFSEIPCSFYVMRFIIIALEGLIVKMSRNVLHRL